MSKIKEQNLYLNDARFYDLDNRDILKQDIPFFLQHAAKTKGDILELACGTGRVSIPLAQAGHHIWALEYSPKMLEQFRDKLKDIPQETASRIRPMHGDMSDFSIGKKFSLIIIPCRAFQLLYTQDKENACLRNVHSHLAEDGLFIVDIGDFVPNRETEKNWTNDKEVLDWVNTDPRTGYTIRRTHIKKEIDTGKQIIYPRKYYYILDGERLIDRVEKRSPWKYFFLEQIRELILANSFEILEELGSYAGAPPGEGSEFIFVCRKT